MLDRDYRKKIDELAEIAKTEDRDAALAELDTMNWRRVHNINALLKAARIYEEADRFDDARDLLEMAHERSPIGRLVIYQLALLCIRMGDLESAQEYYDSYAALAPNEYRKYIIKYRLSIAKGADDYTLIAILEELKKAEFLEDWAYELACLYHKTKQADKCVEVCDEIALYFGSGPYVEKALALKMIYQPLTKEQESQYCSFFRRGSGKETPDQKAEKPEASVPAQTVRLDTINLQEEIKKNIDEIMKATETGEVSENMEIIKNLVGDIPYVQVPKEEVDPEEKKKEEKVSDDTLRLNYQKYLSEEYDGQMAMRLPDDPDDIEIDGQMTIDDVMKNWEKTKRAAEAALEDAKQEKLKNAKEEALAEANEIMKRLDEAKPKLDAGLAPQELLQEEYLSKIDEEPAPLNEEEIEEAEISPEEENTELSGSSETDESSELSEPSEPFVPADFSNQEGPESDADASPASEHSAAGRGKDSLPDLDLLETEGDNVNFHDASQMLANVNEMLQKEIDRLTGNSGEEDSFESSEESEDRDQTEAGLKSAPDAGETFHAESEPDAFDDGTEDSVNREEEIPVGAMEEGNDDQSLLAAAYSAPKEDESEPEKDAFEDGEENEEDEPDGRSVNADPDAEEESDEELPRLDNFDTETDSDTADTVTETDRVEPAPLESQDLEEEAEKPLENTAEAETENSEEPSPEFETDEETPIESETGDSAEPFAVTSDENGEASKEDEDSSAESAADEKEETLTESDTEESEEPSAFPSEENGEASTEETEEPPAEFETEEEEKKPDLGMTMKITNALETAAEQVRDDNTELVRPADLEDTRLSEEEKVLFSYFMPIQGMEEAIGKAITGAARRLLSKQRYGEGCIAIIGGHGSGKTTLAKGIIRVLQDRYQAPGENVGRIDAEKLNQKDIQRLYDRVRGGCLVIEGAGAMTLETVVSLSLLMDTDSKKTLIILEDDKNGMDQVLGLNGQFARKFSERVVIPVFTVEELVNFGKTYASDNGYTIDEMAILAMYDRINSVQRLDRPTYLLEVKEIMDEAMKKASKKGLFHRRKMTEDGMGVLMEKDFL